MVSLSVKQADKECLNSKMGIVSLCFGYTQFALKDLLHFVLKLKRLHETSADILMYTKF